MVVGTKRDATSLASLHMDGWSKCPYTGKIQAMNADPTSCVYGNTDLSDLLL